MKLCTETLTQNGDNGVGADWFIPQLSYAFQIHAGITVGISCDLYTSLDCKIHSEHSPWLIFITALFLTA